MPQYQYGYGIEYSFESVTVYISNKNFVSLRNRNIYKLKEKIFCFYLF